MTGNREMAKLEGEARSRWLPSRWEVFREVYL